MEIVAHRVNSRALLATVPAHYGAEVDIRASGSALVLNHEPFEGGEALDDFLDSYAARGHATLVLNVKEAGIEDEILARVRARAISSYFLLDVEFPYLYRASRRGERAIAVRYSEEEPLDAAKRFAGAVDWVWIDTFTRLPLDPESCAALGAVKSCLVCPGRWRRAADIPSYRQRMRDLRFAPTAVMTSLDDAAKWERDKLE
jgi:hypothetical protein